MTLSDQEIRHLAIDLLTQQTERDRQSTIGASNLANGCDFCLACAFAGISRETPITDRAWGGRVIGTAIHGLLEQRMNAIIETHKSDHIHEIAARFPGALVEKHFTLGIIGGYGPVGTTLDLALPSEQQCIDWKGSTAAKLAILADYLALQRGEEAPYGRQHAVHKAKTLSEKVYAEEMAKMEFKVVGYYDQLQCYGLALNNEGIPTTTLSIVFVARDDTMWFDNPAADRYDDPKAKHGIHVLSFEYNEEYARAVWQRGVDIHDGLAAGKTVSDFARSPLCFPCSLDAPTESSAAVLSDLPAATAPQELVDATFAEITSGI